MKIAVASNNKKSVSGHLGKCKGFLIYETDETSIVNKTYIENTFTHHRMHQHDEHHHDNHLGYGYGHESEHEHSHEHSHQNLIDALNGCSALIFQSGGWRIIEDLQENGIEPVLTDERIADDAVVKYLKGELEIKDDNSCQH